MSAHEDEPQPIGAPSQTVPPNLNEAPPEFEQPTSLDFHGSESP
jgi:hypothetical protein